ncbi:MAG: hypothetical protein IJC11_06860 [Alphaproteobacteria bacterium]|nr:hypothetical protein [Alphaproteobacteria bacterium]
MFVQLVAGVGFGNSQNDEHFGSLSARRAYTSQARVRQLSLEPSRPPCRS